VVELPVEVEVEVDVDVDVDVDVEVGAADEAVWIVGNLVPLSISVLTPATC
jgi:hypothetical protein